LWIGSRLFGVESGYLISEKSLIESLHTGDSKMPIYMYRCNDCNYEFEQRQKMADEPLTECPSCEDGRVRRVVNSVGVVFKGSGFYVTDSRGKKNGTSSGSTTKSSTTDTESTSSSTTDSSTSTESKPEKSKSEKKETTPANP
jgi:putative FmdB family regulatory protein